MKHREGHGFLKEAEGYWGVLLGCAMGMTSQEEASPNILMEEGTGP